MPRELKQRVLNELFAAYKRGKFSDEEMVLIIEEFKILNDD